ncbi:MAG: arylsulfatase [Bacteroidota bacterium]
MNKINGITAILTCISIFQCCIPFRPNRPNIIYIYADDLGYGELGCYGQEKIKTPHLDQLASEGMLFTQHYTGAPVCAPARCMLMTGQHAGHSYIRGNYELGEFADSLEGGQMPLPEGIFTLPSMLKTRGYTTALCGKWGLGMPHNSGSPLKHGFDYYYGYLDQKQAHNHYPTHLWENDQQDTLDNPEIYVHKPLDPATATTDDFEYFTGRTYAPQKITEKAVEFIRKNRKKPFFLYLPYTLPHLSLQVPAEYVRLYQEKYEESPYFGALGYASTLYPRSTYAGMITCLDDQAGQILKTLDEERLRRNTLVMFSSDNGATFNGGADTRFFNSQGILRGNKMDLYEGGIRIPLIVRWPGKIRAGSRSTHICTQYDLMATLADITKSEVPETDGISFLPELYGEPGKQHLHQYLYFEYPEKGGQVAVRMGNWKGVRTNVRKKPDVSWELYNLQTDPSESHNVAAEHPELTKQFSDIQQKEHRSAHIREWEFISPRFRNQ